MIGLSARQMAIRQTLKADKRIEDGVGERVPRSRFWKIAKLTLQRFTTITANASFTSETWPARCARTGFVEI